MLEVVVWTRLLTEGRRDRAVEVVALSVELEWMAARSSERERGRTTVEPEGIDEAMCAWRVKGTALEALAVPACEVAGFEFGDR